MKFIFFIFFISYLFPQLTYCPNQISNRSIYEIGDTLSVDDQNILFPVCNGAGNYSTGDSFSFSDLNGDLNGGEHKITLISMNATW
tara:strand:+ start:311 stop:568 length:258 start_codon:yes stop_codon:yes gene_type:complete